MATKKYKAVVQCTFQIPVEFEINEFVTPEFFIEENSCPGTSVVGRTLDELMEQAEAISCCWACNLGGKNKILAIEEIK